MSDAPAVTLWLPETATVMQSSRNASGHKWRCSNVETTAAWKSGGDETSGWNRRGRGEVQAGKRARTCPPSKRLWGTEVTPWHFFWPGKTSRYSRHGHWWTTH